MFGGNFAPVGWALCQGQLLAISEFETLFNLIGTTYGGDGVSTFALPNLASRVPVHQGGTFVIGQLGGQETVTLTVPQLPSHNHVPLANGTAGQSAPTNNVWAQQASLNHFSSATPNLQMASVAIGNAGGSQPHDNMLPYLAVNFIIALFGVFPTQS